MFRPTNFVPVVGINFGFLFYLPVVYKFFIVEVLKGVKLMPKLSLVICMLGSVFLPIGLMFLAWTAPYSINWSVRRIRGGIFMCGAFLYFKWIVNYLGMSLSPFLGLSVCWTAFIQTMLKGASPPYVLEKHYFFINLSTPQFLVAWRTMVLAFIMTLMKLVPVLFYLHRPKLRAPSIYDKWGSLVFLLTTISLSKVACLEY